MGVACFQYNFIYKNRPQIRPLVRTLQIPAPDLRAKSLPDNSSQRLY